MSAGPFTNTKYEANNGDIYRIRVQPETLAANFGGANSAPTGAINAQGSVRVGGGNRQIGIKARAISIKFTATPPDGYAENQLYRVPILTEARYDGINAGDTGTYLGVTAEVVGKLPERVR